jgi:hypothetical protein
MNNFTLVHGFFSLLLFILPIKKTVKRKIIAIDFKSSQEKAAKISKVKYCCPKN